MVPTENASIGRLSPKRKEAIEVVSKLVQDAEDCFDFEKARSIQAIVNILHTVSDDLVDRYLKLAKVIT